MKSSLSLTVTIALITGLQSMVAAEIAADEVSVGPWRGETILILESQRWDRGLAGATKDVVLSASSARATDSVRAEVVALRHRCEGRGKSQAWPFDCFQFRVRAIDGGFSWSCFAPAFPIPHQFEVYKGESGTNYAAFVGNGLQLFRISEPRPEGQVRRAFWAGAATSCSNHPDALPLLSIDQLHAALGRTNTMGLGPQRWNIVVDQLSDRTGELSVTVHGDASIPKRTFVLRSLGWEVQSASGE